jgi:hypothetical protein
MKRLWLLAFAAGLWAACDVVSNLGDDGTPSCDGGPCPDSGAPDGEGDSGMADTGTLDSGFDGGSDGGCDSTNCLGCCAGNSCIGYSSETNGQCGASGASCAPCGADVCDAGVCVPLADSGHPDSGSDAGCGPGSCTGCCNLSQCVQLLNETNSLCGHGGAACLPCNTDAGATCSTTTGTCV